MVELTEREKKLVDIIKILINVTTINAIYENTFAEMRKTRNNEFSKRGFTMEWQNEILHILEEEFGIKYVKLDENGDVLDGQN